MKKVFLLSSALLFLVACERQFEQNPDPNHTHADFAIWINGEEIDFSGPEFMSGLSTDEHTHDEADERHHEYLHLHDSIGHVLHSHKPGQNFGEFLRSLGIEFAKEGLNLCVTIPAHDKVCEDEALHKNWVMMVNGEMQPFFDTEYQFNDMDKILVVLPQVDDPEYTEVKGES